MKQVVDVYGMDRIIQLAGKDTVDVYNRLDDVHMQSLRAYVKQNVVHKDGDVPRKKKDLIKLIIQGVRDAEDSQVRGRMTRSTTGIDQTTRTYASDSLAACADMKRSLRKTCTRLRGFTKTCRDAKKLLSDPMWVQMETNVERLSRCTDRTCTDSVVDAAGDIGNYTATCPGLTCMQIYKLTGKYPDGACARFRK